MILIIGGAYQGKMDYAKNHQKELGKTKDSDPDFIINQFHLEILEDVRNQRSTIDRLKENWKQYENKIIICDDISCGIVPLKEEERMWREQTGRTLSFLSKQAEQVIRVFCGIGTRLK